MQKPRFSPPTSTCPSCRSAAIVRIDPDSLKLGAATHQCHGCGAKLKGTLKWQKGIQIVMLGVLLMLLGVAAYEASEQLPALPQSVRLVSLLAFLSAVVGYSAKRVVKSLEYVPWQPRR
jgi:hypothetical protein